MIKVILRFLCWFILDHSEGVLSEALYDENYPLSPKLKERACYRCKFCGKFFGWKA